MPPLFNGLAAVSLVLLLMIFALYSQVTKLKEAQIITLESKVLAAEEETRILGKQLTDYERELLIKQTELQIYKQLTNQPNKVIDIPEQENNIPWALIIYVGTFGAIGVLIVYRYICFRQQNYERTINHLLLTKYNGEYYYDFKQKKLLSVNQYDEEAKWREV